MAVSCKFGVNGSSSRPSRSTSVSDGRDYLCRPLSEYYHNDANKSINSFVKRNSSTEWADMDEVVIVNTKVPLIKKPIRPINTSQCVRPNLNSTALLPPLSPKRTNPAINQKTFQRKSRRSPSKSRENPSENPTYRNNPNSPKKLVESHANNSLKGQYDFKFKQQQQPGNNKQQRQEILYQTAAEKILKEKRAHLSVLEEKKKRQRLIIYALNAIMTENENEQLHEFVRQNGIIL